MERTRRLPAELVAHAAAFVNGETTPVRPKGAATVVLVRDGAMGLEAYLLRRHRGMAFAAGMYAFPGGTVDQRDRDRPVAWAGPSPQEWAQRLRCDAAEARALLCAAVRETFEESGVLLAGAAPDTVVADTTGAGWERDRAALVDRSLAFADLLERRRLAIRTDLLAAWAHWITPEFEPRRYDTRFFVSAMPPGQRTRELLGEADKVAWMRPADVLIGVDSGDLAMLPPTYVTLRELSAFSTAADAVAAAADREITTVVPGFELVDGEGFLTLPEHVLP
jgi:8-oxo-dGTP pyrophosphatase MutT (NUDIX family)